MKLTEEIIKSGILGTDRYIPQNTQEIPAYFEKVTATQQDKEDGFFKLAMASFLYEEMGFMGYEVSEKIPVCPLESKTYVNDELLSQIQLFLESSDVVIFNYLTDLALKKGQIVPPYFVTKLLNQATNSVSEKRKNELVQLCGERGKWLCQLNPIWSRLLNKLIEENVENVWETGTLASRKDYFSKLRAKNPQEAIELLAKSIQQEKSEIRVDFLELLRGNLSINDEEFLVSLLAKDKSTSVKKTVLDFLRMIDGSALNLQYRNHVFAAMQVVEKDGKKSFKIDKKVVPSDEIFASGIEKVSSTKGLDDSIYHIIQLLHYVNPSHLVSHYQVDEVELFDMLLDLKKIDVYLLKSMASTFKNKTWARKIILETNEYYYQDLLRFFDFSEVEELFHNEKLKDNLHVFVSYFIENEKEELSENLVLKIIKGLENYHQNMYKSQLQQLAFKCPISVIPLLYKNILILDKYILQIQENITDNEKDKENKERQNKIYQKERVKNNYIELVNTLVIKKQFN